MDLLTILQAIAVFGNDVPEFVALVNMVKSAFSAEDEATITQIMASADAAADAQHKLAQS